MDAFDRKLKQKLAGAKPLNWIASSGAIVEELVPRLTLCSSF
jgi:hypothetical protein